jgi:hypothetical protein
MPRPAAPSNERPGQFWTDTFIQPRPHSPGVPGPGSYDLSYSNENIGAMFNDASVPGMVDHEVLLKRGLPGPAHYPAPPFPALGGGHFGPGRGKPQPAHLPGPLDLAVRRAKATPSPADHPPRPPPLPRGGHISSANVPGELELIAHRAAALPGPSDSGDALATTSLAATAGQGRATGAGHFARSQRFAAGQGTPLHGGGSTREPAARAASAATAATSAMFERRSVELGRAGQRAAAAAAAMGSTSAHFATPGPASYSVPSLVANTAVIKGGRWSASPLVSCFEETLRHAALGPGPARPDRADVAAPLRGGGGGGADSGGGSAGRGGSGQQSRGGSRRSSFVAGASIDDFGGGGGAAAAAVVALTARERQEVTYQLQYGTRGSASYKAAQRRAAAAGGFADAIAAVAGPGPATHGGPSHTSASSRGAFDPARAGRCAFVKTDRDEYMHLTLEQARARRIPGPGEHSAKALPLPQGGHISRAHVPGLIETAEMAARLVPGPVPPETEAVYSSFPGGGATAEKAVREERRARRRLAAAGANTPEQAILLRERERLKALGEACRAEESAAALRQAVADAKAAGTPLPRRGRRCSVAEARVARLAALPAYEKDARMVRLRAEFARKKEEQRRLATVAETDAHKRHLLREAAAEAAAEEREAREMGKAGAAAVAGGGGAGGVSDDVRRARAAKLAQLEAMTEDEEEAAEAVAKARRRLLTLNVRNEFGRSKVLRVMAGDHVEALRRVIARKFKAAGGGGRDAGRRLLLNGRELASEDASCAQQQRLVMEEGLRDNDTLEWFPPA